MNPETTVDNVKRTRKELEISVYVPGRRNLRTVGYLPQEVQTIVKELINDASTAKLEGQVGRCLLCRARGKPCVAKHGEVGETACRACTNAKKPCLVVTSASEAMVVPLLAELRVDTEASQPNFWLDLDRKGKWSPEELWK
jgi:hypothetical protein